MRFENLVLIFLRASSLKTLPSIKVAVSTWFCRPTGVCLNHFEVKTWIGKN